MLPSASGNRCGVNRVIAAGSLLLSTAGSKRHSGPPVTEWCAEATKTSLPLSGMALAWKAQCGLGVALPQRAIWLVPSGRMDQRFWCVTASRSM